MAVGGRSSGEPLDQSDIDAVLAAAQAAMAAAPPAADEEEEEMVGGAASSPSSSSAAVREAQSAAAMPRPAPAIFAPLDQDQPAPGPEARNLDIVMDVPLEVSVELGRKRMSIRQILDLGSGSIVELDKIAGEPVDLLVNGRLVARGEVVVIEDNFGVRITEIIGAQARGTQTASPSSSSAD